MQLALALLAVAFIGTASCLNMDRKIDAELDPHWETFKLMYRKQYDSQFEVVRRIIWESNLKRIQSHNLRYDMGHHSYSMGMNQFGDLTPKEFRALYLGRKRPMRKQSNPSHFMAPLNVKDDPDTLDWRTQGYVTPIKDQGQCGSCWAFSATGSLEGQYFRKNKNLLSFSEQQLVDCSGDQGNQGCDGGLMDQAFEYVKLKGIEQEADYPYTAQDGNCVYDASKVVFNCTGETDIPSGDEKALKHAVASQGPISVAIDASNDSFQFYKNGVYDEPACSSEQLDHGVLAVGYGALSGKNYWLVKNSWGTSWGQQGYIFMSKDKNNQCGIATMASYPNL